MAWLCLILNLVMLKKNEAFYVRLLKVFKSLIGLYKEVKTCIIGMKLGFLVHRSNVKKGSNVKYKNTFNISNKINHQ